MHQATEESRPPWNDTQKQSMNDAAPHVSGSTHLRFHHGRASPAVALPEFECDDTLERANA